MTGVAPPADWPDRVACTDLVIAYADALDARDWDAYLALFEDQVRIDYGAIGSLDEWISAVDWTERCRLLEFFDATRHRVTNLRCRVDGDAATVTSAIDAAHFITVGGETLLGDLCGSYTHSLRRREGRWRISGCRLDVAGYPAGRTAFETVFAAARAKQQKDREKAR